MDPASVIGVIGVVAQITQAIYAYGDAVGECRTEVAQLRCELFGMQAALTQMQQDLTLLQKDGGSTASPSSLYAPQCRDNAARDAPGPGEAGRHAAGGHVEVGSV